MRVFKSARRADFFSLPCSSILKQFLIDFAKLSRYLSNPNGKDNRRVCKDYSTRNGCRVRSTPSLQDTYLERLNRLPVQYNAFDDLDQTIEKMHAAETCDDVLKYLMGYLAQFNITRYFIGALFNPLNHEDDSKRLVFVDFPEDMLAARSQIETILIDPIVLYAVRSVRPFYWSDTVDIAAERGLELLDIASQAGLTEGVVVPITRQGATLGVASFQLEGEKLDPNDMLKVEVVTKCGYEALEAKFEGNPPFDIRLSSREREVLYYAAAGMSFREMGEELGISEPATKDAMRRARVKLGATTTSHAIALAVARRLIHP